MRPFGVPDVDDQATGLTVGGLTVGGLDEREPVVDGSDVGPGPEFDSDLGTGVCGVCGERGELGDPLVVVPRAAAGVGADLDVVRAERLGRVEQVAADLVGALAGGPIRPPVGEQFEFGNAL